MTQAGRCKELHCPAACSTKGYGKHLSFNVEAQSVGSG